MTICPLVEVGDDVAVIFPPELFERLDWKLDDTLYVAQLQDRTITLSREQPPA